MHTYIHTYMHTYIHTYVRTYIHTYIQAGQKLMLDTASGYGDSTQSLASAKKEEGGSASNDNHDAVKKAPRGNSDKMGFIDAHYLPSDGNDMLRTPTDGGSASTDGDDPIAKKKKEPPDDSNEMGCGDPPRPPSAKRKDPRSNSKEIGFINAHCLPSDGDAMLCTPTEGGSASIDGDDPVVKKRQEPPDDSNEMGRGDPPRPPSA